MNKIHQKLFPSDKNAGFTLIELLVVVLIIGVLAAVALPKYEQAVRKTRASNTLTLLRSIKDAEERHFMANGLYTLDFESLDIALPGGCQINGQSAKCGTGNQQVGYSLSLGNFSHPNYYGVTARERASPYILWQWQLDQASTQPGKRICFPMEADGDKGVRLCQSFGGVPCGAYGGWYPGVVQPYCLPD